MHHIEYCRCLTPPDWDRQAQKPEWQFNGGGTFPWNSVKHWLFSGEDEEILQGSAIGVSASWIDLLNRSALDSSVQLLFIRGKRWLLTAVSTTAALLLMALPLGPGMESFTGPIQPLWHYKPMNNSPSTQRLRAAVLIRHTVPVYVVLC